MNILITGCNGQLGNEMQLLEKNYPQHTFFNTDVAELDITNQLAINDFVNRNEIKPHFMVQMIPLVNVTETKERVKPEKVKKGRMLDL